VKSLRVYRFRYENEPGWHYVCSVIADGLSDALSTLAAERPTFTGTSGVVSIEVRMAEQEWRPLTLADV
jgi:hypothetical protein